MNRRVSLEQLQQTTTVQPPEAVAIIQQLIVAPPKTVEAPTPKRASHVTVRSRDREPARPRRFQWLRKITFRADRL